MPLLLAHLDEGIRTRAQGGLHFRTGLDDRISETFVQLDFDGKDGISFRQVHDPMSQKVG